MIEAKYLGFSTCTDLVAFLVPSACLGRCALTCDDLLGFAFTPLGSIDTSVSCLTTQLKSAQVDRNSSVYQCMCDTLSEAQTRDYKVTGV